VVAEIRVHGGCEAHPLAHYLRAHSPSVKVTGTVPAGGLVVSTNATPLLLSACDRHCAAFEREAEALAIPYHILISDFLAAVEPGTAFVFAGGSDGYKRLRYRHKQYGWDIRANPEGLHQFNVFEHTDDVLEAKLDAAVKPGGNREQAGRFVRHIKAHYECVPGETEAEVEQHTRALLHRIPAGCRLVMILDSPRIRVRDNALHVWPLRESYNRLVTRLLEPCPFAAALCFDACIESDDEIFEGGNHFDRKVYFRMAQAILASLRTLSPKQSNG